MACKKIKKYIFKNIIIGNCVSRYYLFLVNRTNASFRKNMLFFFVFLSFFVLVVLSHSCFYALIERKFMLRGKIEDLCFIMSCFLQIAIEEVRNMNMSVYLYKEEMWCVKIECVHSNRFVAKLLNAEFSIKIPSVQNTTS